MSIKIIKGADRSEVHWTARKLVEMVNEGTVDFNIDIQRGYVWKDNNKRSAFICSLIRDKAVPPLYFNKVENIYEGEDGKQRTFTVINFLKDKFELSGLDAFPIINDDGEAEEIDLNGYKFSDLPVEFQDAIKEYNFTISFTDNADQEEVADTFFNLNNGQGMNAATMNRVKAKSKDAIIRLGKHQLFTDSLSNNAIDGHVNEDLAVKAHAIIHDPDTSMSATWIRKYMRNAEITEKDESQIIGVFDRIFNIHSMIEDKKIAKRIYTRTHMISIIPVILDSIKKGLSDKEMMEWFVEFFSGKKSATISSIYNSASGSGSGKKEAVRKRLEELKKNYDEYFKSTTKIGGRDDVL